MLILYRNTVLDKDLNDFLAFMEEGKKTIMPNTELWHQREATSAYMLNKFFHFAHLYGLSGNVWHGFLSIFLVSTENPFSYAWELNQDMESSPWDAVALRDFETIWHWKNYDFSQMKLSIPSGTMEYLCSCPRENVRSTKFSFIMMKELEEFSVNLGKAKDGKEILALTKSFYQKYGIGSLGLNPAFSLKIDDGEVVLDPIAHMDGGSLQDIIGYEKQRDCLLRNTEAFVQGKPANHVLLFGDSGTGKSSCIKALLGLYYEKGLRMIEVRQHQLDDLPKLLKQIRNRNYKFILYIDDLSFEHVDTSLSYLKDVIDHSLEKKADQVLIYATSSQQHNLFGECIYFPSPTPQEFETMLLELAKRADLNLSEEEILVLAKRWELEHEQLSGRVAVQYITHLLHQMD